MTTITLPSGTGYVAAALLSTGFLLAWQSFKVGKHRKLAKIPYPRLYAEKAEAEASKEAMVFNCAQRAHQNTLEFIPVIMVLTSVTAVAYPYIAAGGCFTWVVSRISYTRGYVKGGPDQRLSGLSKIGYLGIFSLLGASIVSTAKLIQAEL